MGSCGKNTSIMGSLGKMFDRLILKEKEHAKRKAKKPVRARMKSAMRKIKGPSKLKKSLGSRKTKASVTSSKKKSSSKKK